MDLTFDMPDSGLTPQEDDLFTDLLPEELLEKYSHFSEITRSNLLTILHDNENTEVGVSLGFSSMNIRITRILSNVCKWAMRIF